MPRRLTQLLPLFALMACAGAWALEPGAGIKVTPILKSSTSWDGTPIAYPEGKPEITGQIVEFQPHAETGWHRHPVPSFGVILEGELEVTLEDGTKKIMKPGDSVVEVVNTMHNGRNTGDVPLKLVVFYAGVVNKPTTQKKNTVKEK